jgi:DNA invertase Pin-like site-specific DNA recombinase
LSRNPFRNQHPQSWSARHRVILVSYARVSTQDQGIALQLESLEKLGGMEIFTDVASGAITKREGLEAALEFVWQGDTLVVWKLDRLGRSKI